MKQTILIIDDDEQLIKRLQAYLEGFGYDVVTATHPAQGLQIFNDSKPHLIILDVMLPDMTGFDVCKEIRKTSDIPVIILSARGETTDRVVGLEIGADDYLPKPFEPRELVARIQSVLRRSREEQPAVTTLIFDGLQVDLDKHQVLLDGVPVELTSTEFELLKLFVQNAGKVLNRDLIMETIAGIEWESYNRSVDVLIHKLRHKLNDDSKSPKYLKTIRGAGYLFLGKPA